MPTCDLCGSEYSKPSHNRFGLILAMEHYEKTFLLKFSVSVSNKLNNGKELRRANLCDNCRQKLFDVLVWNNEKSNR